MANICGYFDCKKIPTQLQPDAKVIHVGFSKSTRSKTLCFFSKMVSTNMVTYKGHAKYISLSEILKKQVTHSQPGPLSCIFIHHYQNKLYYSSTLRTAFMLTILQVFHFHFSMHGWGDEIAPIFQTAGPRILYLCEQTEHLI